MFGWFTKSDQVFPDPTPPSDVEHNLMKDPGNRKDMLDLYKLEAEQFERNHLSMRQVEWQTTLQAFSLYGVIGAVFYQVADRGVLLPWVAVVSILLLLATFTVNLYLSLRLQERLHFSRNGMLDRGGRTRALLGLPKLEEANKKLGTLKDRKWYAFAAQMAMHSIACLAVGAYIGYVACYPVSPTKTDKAGPSADVRK